MDSQVVSEAKSLAKGTFDSSMNYMNLGFTLAAALAWHESAKMLVKEVVRNGTGGKARVVIYPMVVTLLAIVVFRMSKVVNPGAKKPLVVPVVSA
jgi:hypothetical protein